MCVCVCVKEQDGMKLYEIWICSFSFLFEAFVTIASTSVGIITISEFIILYYCFTNNLSVKFSETVGCF